jgi:hypothetical protein
VYSNILTSVLPFQETPWFQAGRPDSPTTGILDTHVGDSSTSSGATTTSSTSARQMPMSPSTTLIEKRSHAYDQMLPSTAIYFGCATENDLSAERNDDGFGRTPRGRIVSVLPSPTTSRQVDFRACPWPEPSIYP